MFVVNVFVLFEYVIDFFCVYINIVCRYICIGIDIFIQFCYEVLCEMYYFEIGFFFWIEVGIVFIVVNWQFSQCIFENLFEVQEFYDFGINGRMEVQFVFVRIDGVVELYVEFMVYLNFVLIIDLRYVECNDMFRFNQLFQ